MKWEKYNARTTRKMAEYNREGGSIRQPVRSTKGATREDQIGRAHV